MRLFSRKKKVEIPSPPSDDLLKFPKPSHLRKEVTPQEIKKITGITPPPKKVDVPKNASEQIQKPVEQELSEIPLEKMVPKRIPFPIQKPTSPFFIRVQHHNQVLDDLEIVKNKLSGLEKLNQNLEKSESSENNNYDDLKDELKKIHDRLTFIDGQIFER